MDALIKAAQQAMIYLGECMSEYDDDSGPPPVEMIETYHGLSQALTALGKHPYAEEPIQEHTDLPF